MTAMNSRELDSFIGELVRFYGVERAIYVLSRTIQFSDWDSRFGQAVLDRAGQTDFPDARTPRDENHVDPTTRYVTEIDPCVANAIFMNRKRSLKWRMTDRKSLMRIWRWKCEAADGADDIP